MMERTNKVIKQEYEMLQALYDFAATVTHTLSFKREELFIFHSGNILSRNWWSVINCNGKLGYIPSNYVAVIKASRGKTIDFINTAIENLSSDISKGGTDKQLELMKELISRKQEIIDKKHRIPSDKEKLTTSKSLPISEKQEETSESQKCFSEISSSLKTCLLESKCHSLPNESLEKTEEIDRAECVPHNPYMLVQQVRNLTGLSQEKSRIAVGVVAEGLIDVLSSSVHPSLETFIELLHKDVTPTDDILDSTLDARNMRQILSHLTVMKEDAQQRSWHLWDDESTIRQNISQLSSILSDADPMICRRVLKTANYEDVNMLVAYYQMEERYPIRQLLIQTFAIMCSLDKVIISILLNSVLPMELAREMQSSTNKSQCLSKPAMLLAIVFSLGEAMPITHLDHLGIDFVKMILLVIEAEDSTEISDLLLTLLLSYNLQFKPKAMVNITVQAVIEAPSVKTFTEKVLLLINREEDPIAKLKTHETPCHSVLKLLNDLFSCPATAKLFYTNDVKVLIDIIVRQITDLPPHNKKRTEYLTLCKLIMYSCDDTAFRHRLDDLNSLFSRIFSDEVPEVPADKYIVRELREALPQYFGDSNMQSHSPCPMATPNMKMETLLKTALTTSTLVRTGQSGGGCINQGEAYITDNGTVFVKSNGRPQARIMFEGEMEGLKALGTTGIVTVPRPISVLDNPEGGACLVMEFIEMKGLRSLSQKLGEDLAKMHMQNVLLENRSNRITDKVQMEYIPNFGFHTVTCCGYIPQENEWNEDWVAFFSQNRLDYQFRLLEKEKGDRDSIEMWSRLQIILPKFFKDQKIRPSLLHGDLWSGNVAQTKRHPVLFDPAAFYGHHEYDLAIAGMFGTFSKSFYDSYHKIIPKSSGFEGRHRLYTLFHYLNHWNHFGDGYKGSAMAVMRSLLK